MTARSGTLTPSVVTSVTVAADANGIEVVNRSETGEIWCRLDGNDPTIAGDDCYVVIGAREFPTPSQGAVVTVKLISDTALDYSVETKVALR